MYRMRRYVQLQMWTCRLAIAVLVSLLLLAATPRPNWAAGGAPAGLHVAGNRLVDGQGRTVVLRGVDRFGSEYMCAQGQGVFGGIPAAYAGAAYQRAITAYVELLNAHGMAVILDLAGVNPGQWLLHE